MPFPLQLFSLQSAAPTPNLCRLSFHPSSFSRLSIFLCSFFLFLSFLVQLTKASKIWINCLYATSLLYINSFTYVSCITTFCNSCYFIYLISIYSNSLFNNNYQNVDSCHTYIYIIKWNVYSRILDKCL